MIKLIIIDHDYNIIGTKPNDQFQKKKLESTKIPIWKVPKIPKEMHEKCMKTWNKIQNEGQKGLTGLWREKPCKKSGRKRQKLWASLVQLGEREKVWKPFWKVGLKRQTLIF